MSRPEWTCNLNDEQWAAVSASDGPVLVIAAAGTGKTQTLTHRVAWLVRERGVNPGEILLLTFTNRAAREMLSRAELLVGNAVGGWWGGTFHHVANRILRRHADLLGYPPDYTILDQEDAEKLIRECSREVAPKDKKFPAPGVLAGIFGLAANKEASVEEVGANHFSELLLDMGQVTAVHEKYIQKKRALGAMDFDDMLSNVLHLFRQQPQVLEYYQKKFKYVLVDEFQDTNKVQWELIAMLGGHHQNIFAVGDDFQSIYSWRGADFRNILSFEKSYPGTRVFFLETNYRSRPEILEIANQVIAGNPEQYQKKLRAVRPPDVRPVRVDVWDGKRQADYVTGKIKTLLESGDVAPRDVVVLYRSHFHSLDLQFALTQAKIPFDLMSGVRFFEQAHIKDVSSLLRLAVNPADRLAFERFIELFPGVGPRRAQTVWEKLGGHLNLRDVDKLKTISSLLPQAIRTEWDDFLTGLQADDSDWGRVLERPDELLYRFKELFYKEFAEENFDNFKRRLEDINELVNFSSRYTNTQEFLSEMALLTNVDHTQKSARAISDNAIRLSTIHQAKGLEWKAVFILWLVDGMFPATKALEDVSDDAEERRLFYVAVTRAKDYLWLNVPKARRGRDGQFSVCMPSRFMNEISDTALQWDKPIEPGRTSFRSPHRW